MPTYHVQQTWRAKRPKTVVSHDLENPSQPPKNEFAKGRSKNDSFLKLEHFLKPCVLCDYKEKEKSMLFEVIWSLGATSNLTQFCFKVEVKIRSNAKLPSIIVTNISRLSPHTTSWFTKARHQHLKTNLQGLLSHVHILVVSESNLKLQVFSLFSRFVRTLIIKISSSEKPANSTSIHRVRNDGKLVILFHLSPKNIIKRWRSPSWKPAEEHWKYQNDAGRAEQILCAHAQRKCPVPTRSA